MKSAIVFGAGGFIGGRVVRKLATAGVTVTAAGRGVSHKTFPEGVHALEIDLSTVTAGDFGLSHYDVAYDFAWTGVNGPMKSDWRAQLYNVGLTLRLAELVSKLQCGRFLCAGTVAEYSLASLDSIQEVPGGMSYAAAKSAALTMLGPLCGQLGVELTWMRLANVYGAGNRTGNIVSYALERILSGRPCAFGPARQPYDLVYVDDAVEAMYRLGAADELDLVEYYIGSGEPKILMDYLLQIGEVAGRQELIQIGGLPDDGIRYSREMFDCLPLTKAVGDYVALPFSERIKETIAEMVGDADDSEVQS